jgi:hypothetical protein
MIQSDLAGETKSSGRLQSNQHDHSSATRQKFEMVKHNSAVPLGLLCLLAVTWATGTARDVPQDKFTAGFPRGMYSMIEAEKYEFNDKFEPELTEAIESNNLTTEILKKMKKRCLEINDFYKQKDRFSTDEYFSNKKYCNTKREEKTKLDIYSILPDGHIKIMWAMVEIGDVNGRCDDRDQWELFLFANERQLISVKTNQVSIDYVNHFGKKKLEKCAPKAIDNLREKPEDFTDDFDKFFKTLFDLPRDASDLELHEALRSTNLLEDELDLAPTLNLFKKDDYVPKRGLDVKKLIYGMCENLAARLNGMLDVILLRELYDSRMSLELDDRVKKWIEYDHACWYVVKYQKKFIRHVDRLLGTPFWKRPIL